MAFLQQAGRSSHRNICESLQLFAQTAMQDFKADVRAREGRKTEELAPYIEAALARKHHM